MTPSPDEARIAHLVDYDEELRLGRAPASAVEPGLKRTEDFLARLQSMWRRPLQRVGSCTLVRSLGQGTIGPCYLGDDAGTPVILKILWPDLCGNTELEDRLRHEAKAVKTLNCDGIASLREVRRAGAVWVVISDYSSGPSLAQWRFKNPQPLAWDAALTLIARLADTLELGHTRGICHGNLKPSNVFLPAGHDVTAANLHVQPLRIAEFALAGAVQQVRLSTHGAHPWPAPQYLAPEQIARRCRSVEPACDVYALGVLLYELLTGRSPVKVTTREDVFAQTRACMPAPVRHYRADVPRAVDEMVHRCLAKQARDRFASGKPLAEALRSHVPVCANTEPPPPAWWRQWLGWM
jgi:serine/threonine-protein kinase